MKAIEKKCPNRQYLQQFLQGQLPLQEIEECQQHLSVCEPCVETIEGLRFDDTFTNLIRQAWTSAPEPAARADDRERISGIVKTMEQRKQDSSLPEHLTPDQTSADRAAEVQRQLGKPSRENDLGQLAHYRILKLLGTGSTGVVYLAEDTQLRRPVVLKILRPSLGEPARHRFIAEAQTTAAINHQNVVTIYEVGTDGPLSYIAMQWIEGQTLEQKLVEHETLPLSEVKKLVTEIAEGLSAAHSHGLIHRDIKPANIWLSADGGPVKILDFGLVRITDEDPQLTCTGLIAGTPCYMSPEQSRGDQLDTRSDLFSLGCLMYQSLTGRLPFVADNALATLRSIQQDQPTAPGELDPSISADISELTIVFAAKITQQTTTNGKGCDPGPFTAIDNHGNSKPSKRWWLHRNPISFNTVVLGSGNGSRP